MQHEREKNSKNQKGRGRDEVKQIEGGRFILRNWFTQLCSLANLKSSAQTSRLETQGRVDFASLVQRESGDKISFS